MTKTHDLKSSWLKTFVSAVIISHNQQYPIHSNIVIQESNLVKCFYFSPLVSCFREESVIWQNNRKNQQKMLGKGKTFTANEKNFVSSIEGRKKCNLVLSICYGDAVLLTQK